MTARILVVDDVVPNVKLLEARLAAEYFQVRTASSGPEALRMCALGDCDIVLLDVMMPGMDGFEVCRRLKANPETAGINIVMVTALDQPADRVRSLDAGADDFLTKPVDETTLIARVRSLARMKLVDDELRARAATSTRFGQPPGFEATDDRAGRVLLVEDRATSSARLLRALSQQNDVEAERDPERALFRAGEGAFDLVVVGLGLTSYDALRLCSQLRSLERTRNIPVLVIAEREDRPRVLRALDLGVNDYLLRPIDRNELLVRARIQIRRKRQSDRLRDAVQESLQMAVVDPLTGLNNRRYLDAQLGPMIEVAAERNRPMSLMILDIDHFKAVNDTFGHDAGDTVLRTFASRVKAAVRTADLLCRLGGEEFIIVMPDTSLDVAAKIAERVRQSVSGAPFPIDKGLQQIQITVSIGLADRRQDIEAEPLLRRADRGLYRSKQSGRNRVTADAA